MHLLRALADRLTTRPDEPLPAEMRERLIAAVTAVEYGQSIECALGVDFHRRNAAIRRAGELLCHEPAPHTRANEILRALSAYERRRAEPVTEVDHCLDAALRAGPVPRSRKQLARICGKYIDVESWT